MICPFVILMWFSLCERIVSASRNFSATIDERQDEQIEAVNIVHVFGLVNDLCDIVDISPSAAKIKAQLQMMARIMVTLHAEKIRN